MIKVVHILSGNLDEGASKGAYMLHLSLLNKGINSILITNSKKFNNYKEVLYYKNNLYYRFISRLFYLFDKIIFYLSNNSPQHPFSTGLWGFKFRNLKVIQEADVVNLHWIQNFISLSEISKINKPIIWTLRDMWPFTGGCYYSLNCSKYRNGCIKCPQLKSNFKIIPFKIDLSKYLLKKKIINKKIFYLGISKWVAKEAKISKVLKNNKIINNNNLIDIENFYIDPDFSILPKKIDIKNKKIILIGAINIQDFYKGYNFILDTIKNINNNNNLYLFFGNNQTINLKSLNINFYNFGFIKDQNLLRKLYSISDVFLFPSLQETFGKTMVESLFCGTPVVAFDNSSPKYLLKHKVSGYLAKSFDLKDFINGIDFVLGFKNDQIKRISISKKIRLKINKEKITQDYLKICDSLIGNRADQSE